MAYINGEYLRIAREAYQIGNNARGDMMLLDAVLSGSALRHRHALAEAWS